MSSCSRQIFKVTTSEWNTTETQQDIKPEDSCKTRNTLSSKWIVIPVVLQGIPDSDLRPVNHPGVVVLSVGDGYHGDTVRPQQVHSPPGVGLSFRQTAGPLTVPGVTPAIHSIIWTAQVVVLR